MAFIKHESFLSTSWEQIENELIHKDELAKILSSHKIKFEIHQFLLKIYDASFLICQNHSTEDDDQIIGNSIKNCIDIKTLDLSECDSIPRSIDEFPFIDTIIFPLFLHFIPRIKNCPSLKHVRIPEHGIEYIESRNFENYPQIELLRFDEHLRIINTNAFSSASIRKVDLSLCVNLESINIKAKAFSSSNIEEIILPIQVNILPFGAFSNCKELRSIKGADLLATYYDEYNEGYVRFDRTVHTSEFCFEKCNNLQYIHFSQELSIEGIKRLFCHVGFREDSNSSESNDHYYDMRCGIVLEIDDFYAYIWCFTDFKFYVYKKIDDSFLNKIVKFYNSNNRNVEVEDGNCWFFCNNKDFVALGVTLGCNYHFNEIFNRHGFKDGAITIENDQAKALVLFENQILISDVDIEAKVHEFETIVDDLDIDSIIDSYHSTRHYDYISHYRSDDDEQISVLRSASYKDAYIEKILPTQYYYSKRGYADTNNHRLGHLSEEQLHVEDENVKRFARHRYNKEEHKRFVINNFVIEIAQNEKNIEKYLRIEEARQLLMRFGARIDGNQKVITLNSIINKMGINSNK